MKEAIENLYFWHLVEYKNSNKKGTAYLSLSIWVISEAVWQINIHIYYIWSHNKIIGICISIRDWDFLKVLRCMLCGELYFQKCTGLKSPSDTTHHLVAFHSTKFWNVRTPHSFSKPQCLRPLLNPSAAVVALAIASGLSRGYGTHLVTHENNCFSLSVQRHMVRVAAEILDTRAQVWDLAKE